MIVSQKHKLVVYDASEVPDGVEFDHATALGDRLVLPLHLDTMRKARANGMVVPPIMDYNYDWPIKRGWHPTLAQRSMASFMALNQRCFNLSEMRTGKTLSALWAADYVMGQSLTKMRALVVAPLRTLERTWRQTIQDHFLGKRTCVTLHGTPEQRLQKLSQDVDFYLINYDGLSTGASINRSLELRGFAKALFERGDIDIIIIDESSAYKHPTTQRHRVARMLFRDRSHIWLMTGTPTPQGPIDAYGQARLVNGAFGETLTAYRDRVMTQVSKFKFVPAAGANKAVHKLLSPAIRFTQDECFDSPDVVVMQEDARMSEAQEAAYERMKRDLTLQIRGNQHITAVNEGVMRMKLIQIACGALYDDDKNIHTLDASPRLAVLKEVIEASPRKIIVFAPLTSVLNQLILFISKFTTCALVNGSVSSREADERLRGFQSDKDIRVLVAHPGPIARGLDLTAAATIIWYAPTDRTEDYLQANERINGPNQTHKRTIVQISASKVEREIYRRLEANESMQGAMLALLKAGE